MRRIFLWVWLGINLLVMIGVWSSFFWSGRAAFFDFLSLFPQSMYVVAFSILLLLGYLLLRKISYLLLLVPVIGILCCVVWLLDLVWIYTPASPSAGVQSIRVVNWNTEMWDRSREEAFFTVMKAHPADVYLLQEVESSRAKGVDERVQAAFPAYQVAHHGEFLTLSRYPIIYSAYPRSQGYAKHEILLNGRTITFFNIHLRVPIFGDRSLRNNAYDYALRKVQFTDLERDLYSVHGPLFMAGDFNSTRNYAFIRILEQQLKMNQPAGLFVFPKTYHTSFPAIRIDYQFVDKASTFTSYTRFGGTISDHFGIDGEFYVNY